MTVNLFFKLIVVLSLSACCNTFDNKQADIIPKLQPNQVIRLANEHMIKIGIDITILKVSSGPELDKDGWWYLIYEEINAPLELRTSSYGISIKDSNPNSIILSPGI